MTTLTLNQIKTASPDIEEANIDLTVSEIETLRTQASLFISNLNSYQVNVSGDIVKLTFQLYHTPKYFLNKKIIYSYYTLNAFKYFIK